MVLIPQDPFVSRWGGNNFCSTTNCRIQIDQIYERNLYNLIGSVTVLCRASISPGPGGDSTVSVMCPCARPSKVEPSEETDKLTAIQPDHGHNNSECEMAISSIWPC